MKAIISRRWVRILVCGGLLCCAVDAFLIEPHWIKVNRLSLSDHPTVRIVHISDIHYKGDPSYLARIVAGVNALSPDIVCFTGDIVEDTRYLKAALDALSRIKAPLYGVPGNHEYWCGASFAQIGACFRMTGGQWLVDRTVAACAGKLVIVGMSGYEMTYRWAAADFAMPGRTMDWSAAPCTGAIFAVHSQTPGTAIPVQENQPAAEPGAKRILLTHYPAAVDSIKGETYDLVLAGHAHGGQVRLPLLGALVVPFGVNGYQVGTYVTAAGRLHVSAGLGTFLLPVRFFCRPEITLIEL